MKPLFIAKETWAGVRANPGMFLSIVLVTFVSMSFVAATALLQLQLANFKDFWFERSQVVVYLCNDLSGELSCPTGGVTDAQVQELRSQLASPAIADYLSSVRFESQEQAFARLKETKTAADELQYITPEQLNASFWLQLSDPENAAIVVESLEGQPGVAEVQDQRGFFDPIISILNNATLVSGSIASVMLLSAALLTTTTIRLSAFTRRREISIKRLVGASSFSIQLPFILEGLLAALLGTGLSVSLAYATLDRVDRGALSSELSIGELVSVADVISVTPQLLQISLSIALVASVVSTVRHIRT
jgi:cell division transport system permease protein